MCNLCNDNNSTRKNNFNILSLNKISRRDFFKTSVLLVGAAALSTPEILKISDFLLPSKAYGAAAADYTDDYLKVTAPAVSLYDYQGNFSGSFTITNLNSAATVINSISLSNKEANTSITFDKSTPFTMTSGEVVTVSFTGTTTNDSGTEFKASDINISYSATKPAQSKYAVSLYGIKHDVDQSGNAIGLTFGPAIAASYISSYKEHTPSGNTSSGNAHRCIHNDSWEEIITWSKKDPYVYEQCLTNGCTHGVELTLNSTLKRSEYSFTGDGTGILCYSLNSTYRAWNGTSSSYNNTGGWRASFMRRTLNGSDYCNTVDGGNTISSCTQGATPLTSENCLLSCFPTVLQNNIKAAAKKTDTVYNDTSGNNMTTYDKLWLLSGAEIWQSGASTNYARPNEGTQYEYLSNLGVASDNYGSLKNYLESGNADFWWSRSSSVSRSSYVCTVNGSGGWRSSHVYRSNIGCAPCFCL